MRSLAILAGICALVGVTNGASADVQANLETVCEPSISSCVSAANMDAVDGDTTLVETPAVAEDSELLPSAVAEPTPGVTFEGNGLAGFAKMLFRGATGGNKAKRRRGGRRHCGAAAEDKAETGASCRQSNRAARRRAKHDNQ